MKICNDCKINEVKYNNGKCKECNTAYMTEYRKTQNYKKCYIEDYKKTKEKRLAYKKEYYQSHKKERAKYMRDYRKENPKYRAQDAIMTYINKKIKERADFIEYLGCSWEEFFVYLEKQFNKNMSWENYGMYWEIDHIHPLSKGGSFHYTNTQPLTVTENRSKGNKL
jgi:5-methylcytosine-specific restriction endonuclease McrA